MWPPSIGPSCGVTVPLLRPPAAGRLLRSWRRVMETLRHGTGGLGQGAELLAVAVDPAMRGRGAGTLLVDGFLTEIGRAATGRRPRGGGGGNETAVALYRRAGFRTVERFELHPGTESLLMQWAAPPGDQVVSMEVLARRRGRSRARRWPYRRASWSRIGSGVIDRPGPLKTHETPVPYLGGVAVFAGVVVGGSVGRPVTLIPSGRSPGGRGQRRPLRPFRHHCGSRPSWAWERVIAVTLPVHLPGWIGVPLVMVSQCRPDQRLQPARRPRHAGRRRRRPRPPSGSPSSPMVPPVSWPRP